MLEMLTTKTAMELARVHDPLCVSLILPTTHGPEGAKEGRLRLKNLLASARDEVRARTGALQTDELLAPAEEILEDDKFWRDVSQGLAIYLAKDVVKVRRVPGETSTVGLVADRFAITPTLPALIPDTQFRVLALSLNHAHVFLGDRHNLSAIRVPDLPDGLDDALWFESSDNLLNRHGGMRFGSGGRLTSTVHGSNSQNDEDLQRHAHYFRLLDDALVTEFGAHPMPLVVAAVEREIAGFVSHSKLTNVLKAGIVGNPDETSLLELHAAAWAAVEPFLQQQLVAAQQRYNEFAGTGRTSNDPMTLAAAAAGGFVETLFVDPDATVWSKDGSSISTERLPGDRELVNEAVTDTWVKGGDVWPVSPGWVHQGSSAAMAGILRPGWN